MRICKVIPVLAVLLFVVQIAMADNCAGIKERVGYIWAEAEAPSESIAAEKALSLLVLNLADAVEVHPEREINVKLMEGYTKEILRESRYEVKDRRGKYSVLRYIHKDSLSAVFDGRRSKILQMLALAESAQEKLQIDVAMRNYSWAEILLKSIPQHQEFNYRNRSGKVVSAHEWISEQLAALAKGMDARFTQRSESNSTLVEIDFTYNGKPVRNVDYRFFNGKQWSQVYSAKDGRGVIENPLNTDVSSYRIKYESESSYMMHIDSQVKKLKELFDPQPAIAQVKNQAHPALASTHGGYTIKEIDMREVKSKIMSVLAGEQNSGAANVTPLLQLSAVQDPTEYEAVAGQFCAGLSSPNSIADSIFTPDGYKIFKKLIQYGNARLLDIGKLNFYRMGEEVYCRSIPMVFSFPGNSRKFVEDIVLTFNNEKRISNITFSLGKGAAGDIVSHANWPEEARIILVTFLENYKTAYALERLDYISSIFDDDALIITGRVVKNVNLGNELMDSKYVVLTKHNKEHYVSHLKQVFASNEFINIQFSDSQVLMMGKDRNLFGIQICQDYYSTNYSDKGYLFLMVDLRDYSKPVIHVRTWQTAPDKEFGIIGPHHF